MEYLLIKWIHIISSTLLFGTGLGSAFYKYVTDRSHNIQAIGTTNRIVVLADWLFTTPTIIIQPVTGIMMVLMAGFSLSDSWLLLSIVLYIVAGVCWLPVVVLQIRMRDLSAEAISTKTQLPDIYWQYTKTWFWLGVPAFCAMMCILYLMTLKPHLYIL